MNCLILAAAPSIRFGGVKHQLEVGGESIIVRLIRQVKSRGGVPILFTNSKYLGEVSGCEHVVYGPRRRTQMEACLFDMEQYWTDPCLFIFGDSIVSKEAMDHAFSSTPFKFYGSLAHHEGEGYMWLFRPDDVKEHLVRVCRRVLMDPGIPGVGFNMIQSMLGLDMADPKILFDGDDERFVWLTDYTQDIDFQRDYVDFVNKVKHGEIVLDDLPEEAA